MKIANVRIVERLIGHWLYIFEWVIYLKAFLLFTPAV